MTLGSIDFSPELLSSILKVALIIILTLIARWGIHLAFNRLENRVSTIFAGQPRLPRINTLLRLGRGVAVTLVFMIGGMMILQTLAVNITPILASAGVVGLALSLGTQTLVKDYIGGLLILIENQFDVGDVIEVEDFLGTVERITLRSTSLRAVDGKLHIIPNGEIRALSNLTEDWSRVVVELNLDYEADLNQVLGALRKAAEEAKELPDIMDDLLEEPQVAGWVGLNDWALQARLTAKVKPGQQWRVANVMRPLAVNALHAAGVQVALPWQAIKISNPSSKGE